MTKKTKRLLRQGYSLRPIGGADWEFNSHIEQLERCSSLVRRLAKDYCAKVLPCTAVGVPVSVWCAPCQARRVERDVTVERSLQQQREIAALKGVLSDVTAALLVILDETDYTRKHCSPTSMVAAVLSPEAIKNARKALSKAGIDSMTELGGPK